MSDELEDKIDCSKQKDAVNGNFFVIQETICKPLLIEIIRKGLITGDEIETLLENERQLNP